MNQIRDMNFKWPYCANFCPKFYSVLDTKCLLLIILLRNTHNMCSYFHHERKCFTIKWQYKNSFFEVLLTVHLSIFILVINQLDAKNFCLTISLFHASTRFEHMCSSSGGQNCIIQPLVSSHSVGGRPVHKSRENSSLNLRTGRLPIAVMIP